jgi:hypothetical protein
MKAYTQVDIGGRGHDKFREVEVFGHRNGICLVKDGGEAGEVRREFLYNSDARPLMRINVACLPSLDGPPTAMQYLSPTDEDIDAYIERAVEYLSGR